MATDFSFLPEVSDFIRNPVYDKNLTDITSLVLKGDAIRNPLEGKLRSSIGNLNNSISQVSELQKRVQQAKQARQDAGFGSDGTSGVLGPSGLGDGVLGRAQGIAGTPGFEAAMAAMETGKNKMVAALGQSNRMLDHSKLMTNNIPTVGGIVNGAISDPYKFTSESFGSLPESFPDLMPSFQRNALGGNVIPNFEGLELPSIPSLDLPHVSLAEMPNVAELTGVSIPGAPIADDVLKGFSGSLTGVGPQLTSAMSEYSKRLPDLTGKMSDIVERLNVSPLDPLDGIPLTPALPTPEELADIADFSSLTDGMGELGLGAEDMVGGEEGGIFSMTCSQLALGGACSGLPSLSDASGLAGSLANLASTESTAQLVDSVATGSLKTSLSNIAEDVIERTNLQNASLASVASSVQGQISETVSENFSDPENLASNIASTGVAAVGGAITNSADSITEARQSAGQGFDTVGGIGDLGKDAITQAQTLASQSISEAQVAAKAIANSSLDELKDQIKDQIKDKFT